MSGREDDRRRVAAALRGIENRLSGPVSAGQVPDVQRDPGDGTGQMVAK